VFTSRVIKIIAMCDKADGANEWNDLRGNDVVLGLQKPAPPREAGRQAGR
jgi:hypothetical protein